MSEEIEYSITRFTLRLFLLTLYISPAPAAQFAHRHQVFFDHGFDFGRFQNERFVAQLWMCEKSAHRVAANGAFADVFVAIQVFARRAFGIVEMNDAPFFQFGRQNRQQLVEVIGNGAGFVCHVKR